MSLIESTVQKGKNLVALARGKDGDYFRNLAQDISARLTAARARADNIEISRQQAALAEQEGAVGARRALDKANADAAAIGADIRNLEAALAQANQNAAAENEREAQAQRDAERAAHRAHQRRATAIAREIDDLGRKLADALVRFDGEIGALHTSFAKANPSAAFLLRAANRLSRAGIAGIWAEFIAARGVPCPIAGAGTHETRPNIQDFAAEVGRRLKDYDLQD